MKVVKKACMKKIALAALCLWLGSHAWAQLADGTGATLVQGYEAYRDEDWHSAVIFFRKAIAASAVSTDETWYFLIMSEVNAGEYAAAHADCVRFVSQFSFSQYAAYVQYQNGRCLHFLGQHENAILVLSDFCHQNPDHLLYASALYWIAESFFAEYNFDAARGLYERIVKDFPNDAKTAAAQYRLEAIDQRSREEKLLYLLKMTGEENLAAREDYERRIRQYETEDKFGLRQQLSQAEGRIQELERELAAAREEAKNAGRTADKDGGVHDVFPGLVPVGQTATDYGAAAGKAGQAAAGESAAAAPEMDADVLALKRKAKQLQYLLDEQKSTESAE